MRLTQEALDNLEFVRPTCDGGQLVYTHDCDDENGHLYVSVDSGKWICYKCGYYGEVKGFDKKKLPAFLPKPSVKAPTLFEVGAYPVPAGGEEYQYLVGRGLTEEMIRYYQVMLSPKSFYSRQILFPVYDDGYKGFVRRTIDKIGTYTVTLPTGVEKTVEFRYLNSPGMDRRRIIYDFDRAKKYDTVYLAEGIFSKIALGPSAVAFLGKGYTKFQMDKLLELPRKTKYIVALDGDAVLKGIDLQLWLSAMGRDAATMVFPYQHDPASIGNLAAVPIKRFSQMEAIKCKLNWKKREKK